MPVQSRFDGPVLRLTPSGDYTWAQLRAAVEEAMKLPAFIAGTTMLMFDAAFARKTRSADELRDIAADLAELAGPFAAILIVTADDLRFGLARMLAAYAEHLGTDIHVFRSEDAARAWVKSLGS